MLRYVAAAAAVTLGATAVYAQNLDAIKARKDSMKALSAAAKAPGGMTKGEVPFELAKVQAALKTFQDEAAKQKGLYPDNAKEGGETEAMPAIWEKRADFEAKLAKLGSDAKAAEGAIKDEATFKAEWGKVMSNCGACHKEYRKPK